MQLLRLPPGSEARCVGDLPGDIQLFSHLYILGSSGRARRAGGRPRSTLGCTGPYTRAYREKKLAMPVCLRPREASRAASLAAAL